MSEWSKGFWAMIGVCVTWGLSPIFYRSLSSVPVAEVLIHRTIWSLVLFMIVLAVQGRLGQFRDALTGPYLGRIAFASVMISANWALFIWAIQAGQTVQASLGYYIYPLVAVMLGVVVFSETLRPVQGAAIALAALAVGLLTWGLGVAPWISLALAITFAFYGLAKKTLPLGPVISVACEVALLTPVALLWLLCNELGWLPGNLEAPMAFGQSLGLSLMLMSAGIITAVPLILFSYASRRLGMATVGLMQYLNPTLQFFCAVVLFGESFTRWHMIAFALIWTALAIYSASGMQLSRRELHRNGA